KATANHVACHCGGISLIPWRLDAPTSLVVATAAKIIHHILPHIAQIASIARIEFVDFAEIDGGAKPKLFHPLRNCNNFQAAVINKSASVRLAAIASRRASGVWSCVGGFLLSSRRSAGGI